MKAAIVIGVIVALLLGLFVLGYILIRRKLREQAALRLNRELDALDRRPVLAHDDPSHTVRIIPGQQRRRRSRHARVHTTSDEAMVRLQAGSPASAYWVLMLIISLCQEGKAIPWAELVALLEKGMVRRAEHILADLSADVVVFPDSVEELTYLQRTFPLVGRSVKLNNVTQGRTEGAKALERIIDLLRALERDGGNLGELVRPAPVELPRVAKVTLRIQEIQAIAEAHGIQLADHGASPKQLRAHVLRVCVLYGKRLRDRLINEPQNIVENERILRDYLQDSGLTLAEVEFDEEAIAVTRRKAFEGKIKSIVAVVRRRQMPEGGLEELKRMLLLVGGDPARLGVTDEIINRMFLAELVALGARCLDESSYVEPALYEHVLTIITRRIVDRDALLGLQILAGEISEDLRWVATGLRVRAEQGSTVHLRILREMVAEGVFKLDQIGGNEGRLDTIV